MTVAPGGIYWFLKSGNQVRAISVAANRDGSREWEVERVSGDSVGKRMLVSEKSLVATIEG